METSIEKQLARRINAADIRRICAQLQGNAVLKQSLYDLFLHPEPRVANNAAWVFTHLDAAEMRWLIPHTAELTEAVVSCRTHVKPWLLLTLLNALPVPDSPRMDFLDFCIERLSDPAEKGGVRSVCIKLAYALCRPYPELTEELRQHLELLQPEFLSPAVRCARRSILRLMQETE